MVRIVQLLCSERHCLLAVAYEEGKSTFEKSRAAMEKFISSGQINCHCGICGSRDLIYEDGETKFLRLEEAGPWLASQMDANIRTRALLDAAGLTFDKRRQN
jgi:hypothetical protein